MPEPIPVDGRSLTLGQFLAVARGHGVVALPAEARTRIGASRGAVERAVAANRAVYGVTTGFGGLSHKLITGSAVPRTSDLPRPQPLERNGTGAPDRRRSGSDALAGELAGPRPFRASDRRSSTISSNSSTDGSSHGSRSRGPSGPPATSPPSRTWR